MKCRPLSEADQAEAIRLYQSGQSAGQIGALFGRTESAICALMRRKGVSGGPYRRPEDYEAAFLKLRAEGLTSAEIAERLKVTVRTVEWWVRRGLKNKILARRPSPKGEEWTDDQAERLKRLWATKGPAEISRETGWTVGRIAAKARRLGLPRRTYPESRKAVVGRTFKRQVAPVMTAEERAQRREDAAEARRQAAATLWQPTPASRPFLTVTGGECRWPLGDRGGFQACCAPTTGLDSYCPHHRMIAGGDRTTGYAAATLTRRGPATVFDQGRRA